MPNFNPDEAAATLAQSKVELAALIATAPDELKNFLKPFETLIAVAEVSVASQAGERRVGMAVEVLKLSTHSVYNTAGFLPGAAQQAATEKAWEVVGEYLGAKQPANA